VSWRCTRVVLRLASPMHVGWRAFGNVKVTRPYLPGRTLWGALTARLARDFPQLGGYEAAGQTVHRDLAFSYFYASLSPDSITWPFEESWWEFSSLFLGSYASTALADGRSKEDGSLHETEFLSPTVEDGRTVLIVGHVFEREGARLRWREVIGRTQFGGERSYGWGRVSLHQLSEGRTDAFGMALALGGARPVVRWSGGERALAHVRANPGWRVDGAIEPLVGRITNPQRGVPGAEHSGVEIAWTPGSRLREEAGVECTIAENGIWVLPAAPAVSSRSAA